MTAMARTVVIQQSERKETNEIGFDKLHFSFFAIHVAIVVYISLGWLITSRYALYFYTLLLPAIVLQWLLNGGCSIVNNFENLARVGRWSNSTDGRQGAFFRTVLGAVGVRATEAQITTALCSLMLIFWTCAVCRMVLIVS
jgi:hypothetical protein